MLTNYSLVLCKIAYACKQTHAHIEDKYTDVNIAAKNLIFIWMLHMSVPYELFTKTHTHCLMGWTVLRANRPEGVESLGWAGAEREKFAGLVYSSPGHWKLQRESLLWCGDLLVNPQKYVCICCTRESERHECWQHIVPALSFIFLISRSHKALRLTSTSSRSLPTYLHVRSLDTNLNKA